MKTFEIRGNIIDVENKKINYGKILVANHTISKIELEGSEKPSESYILPGLIDAHIHIESTMVVPSEFARTAVKFGTVAVVSDPHEIANVIGLDGILFMIENSRKVPMQFYFGAPSCVPATPLENAGATISEEEIEYLFKEQNLHYLSEMMNYPGVIYDDPAVLKKINIAKKYNKPIDGHAPGLRGDNLKKYISAGISTDHETLSYEEALEKINLGMKILIREGSAAQGFDVFHPLINQYPDMCMFCSDDKHPNDLVSGHINELVKRAINLGYNIFDILRIASINPIKHYNLDIGTLKVNDYADFIVVDNLKDFNILKTYIRGELVAENGEVFIPKVSFYAPNKFNCSYKTPANFEIPQKSDTIRVIEVIDRQIFTEHTTAKAKAVDGKLIPDIENDILKLAVVDRYNDSKPAVAFVRNFGLKRGAIAGSISHDSHNIIAVGCDDLSISNAVNAIIKSKGGLAVCEDNQIWAIELPIAGLMSNENCETVASKYSFLESKAKELGSHLHSPFMTLSFLALIVIPRLKLSSVGLFDADKFQFVELQI